MANYSMIDNNYISNINYSIANNLEAAYISNRVIPLEESYQTLLDERSKHSFVCDTSSLKPDAGETDEDIVNFKQHLKVAQRFKSLKEKREALVKQSAELQAQRAATSTAADVARESATAFEAQIQPSINTHDDGKHVVGDFVNYVNRKLVEYQKKIDAKIDALQADIDALDTRLNILRTVISAAVEDTIEPGEIASKKMCAVCFENEVNMVSVPCGHTMCGGCVKSTGLDRFNPANRSRYSRETDRPKCPHCRTTVDSVVKIFFSV